MQYSLENQYFMWMMAHRRHITQVLKPMNSIPAMTVHRVQEVGAFSCPEDRETTLHLGGIHTQPPIAQQDKVESYHMTPVWHLQL